VVVYIRPLEETVQRYVRGCLFTYLEGKKDLRWILGVLENSGATPEQCRDVLRGLDGYGDPQRYLELDSSLRYWVDEGWRRSST
jgi:hypothetical protein